jgi:16S rRNA (guanine(966)-N(2))-methyltransferase RsmD
MRVVGGSAKGKPLRMVPGSGTRPIMDRVKTALFDILRPRIDGMELLDLFAGSGSVGIEALSQGAARCTFLDLGEQAVRTIRQNLATTGLADRAEVRRADALAFLRTTDQAFDLIYVAPPQYKGLWADALRRIAARPELLRPDGLVIAQIDPKEYEALDLGPFEETRRKPYGSTLLVFYEPGPPPNPA